MLDRRRTDLEQTTARPVAFFAGLAVLVIALALVLWSLQPPAPLDASAPADAFSAGRAEALLQSLLGDDAPHPIGTAAHDRLRDRIVAELEALGYRPALQQATACQAYNGAGATCGTVQNILAEFPGQSDGPAVLLVAHYDGGGVSAAAADDGSAVVVLLEIARLLQAQGPQRNPVLFLFSDGEEVNLLGARAFCRDHPWLGRVGAVINLEARGTTGRAMMFETSADNAWLIEAYATVPHPAANSLMYEAYKAMPNSTDFSVFREAGLAGLNLAYIEGGVRYHTPLDNLGNLDRGSLQHQGEVTLALVRALAQRDLAAPPPGDAAYMDLLGLGLLRWPAAWTLPLAVVALLLPAAAAAGLLFRRRLSFRALGQGLLAALLAMVLPILLGLGLTWMVTTLTGNATPWYAYPLPMRLALWVGALLCTVLAGARLGRAAGFWGLAAGLWLFWGLLALLVALLVPGAAILLIVPTLWAGLLLAAVALTPLAASPWAREGAVLAAALPAAVVGLQLALQFESALRFNASPTITLAVGLVAGTLLPLLARPPAGARQQRMVALAAAAVTVAGTLAAIVVPPFSAAAPMPFNLYHVEDSDAGTASWAAGPRLETLPSPLRELYDAEPRAIFPWSTSERAVAVAVPTGAPAPGAEVLATEPSATGRTVALQLRSPRGGSEVDLYVPIGALQAVNVAGQDLPVRRSDAWNGFYNLWCYGAGCDGLEVTLRFTDSAPQEVLVADWTMGLPPGGERFAEARPAWAITAYEGDLTAIIRRIRF